MEYEEGTCPRCKNLMEWKVCDQCEGTGLHGHECGDDTCACAEQEDNLPCDECDGKGGAYVCHVCEDGEVGGD